MQLDLTALSIQIRKNTDLALQKEWFDRLGKIINRSGVISLELKPDILHAGGDKDDRYMPGLRVCTHQLSRLKTIHFGHLHIQQHQGIILFERLSQSFITG